MVKKKIAVMSLKERKFMIDKKNDKISITEQCNLLSISRSGLYYKPTPESEENLLFMSLIDEQYLKTPFYGTRRMAVYLCNLGYQVNRKRVRRLFIIMGIRVIYPKPNLSKPDNTHKKYPYLLRDLNIVRVNQVWEADVTYIRMYKGFMYLLAIIDVYSRYVVGWGISNTNDTGFYLKVLASTIEQNGTPEIFNTDQGSQFTSNDFTKTLEDKKILISMNGKGRALDNIFIERLWRSVKQEYIYINHIADGKELHKGISEYFKFYNTERPHQSLNYITPKKTYKMIA
jgi:putative transposase